MDASDSHPAAVGRPACKTAPPQPILLKSPSKSKCRVSFVAKPQIKEIAYSSGKPATSSRRLFETRDKTLVLDPSMRADVKRKARRHVSVVATKESIVVKYKRRVDMEADMRALGLLAKTYIENKILVSGLGYRETEESVAGYFGEFGAVEKAVLERNSKGFCTGKATVTFREGLATSRQFRLNGRLLQIERIKKVHCNTTRLCISHMGKKINISVLRAILKEHGFVPRNIRIDLNGGGRKNKGYGFVEFNTAEESQSFVDGYARLRDRIGADSYVEFSKEKKQFVQ